MRYDTIGRTYSSTRRADPRIAAQISAALGEANRVVNVGAGTGSYEPEGRVVAACDPSATMLAQRSTASAPAVLARAEALPFPDRAFDAALATLTVHHWDDRARGLHELRRVAPRQVVLYFEPQFASGIWVYSEYFPEWEALATERAAPGLDDFAEILDIERVEVVPVPADCLDGFGGSYWNRPEGYLDPVVQAGISGIAQLDPEARRRGTEKLRHDLETGAWDERHGALRSLSECDLGYRLLIASSEHLS